MKIVGFVLFNSGLILIGTSSSSFALKRLPAGGGSNPNNDLPPSAPAPSLVEAFFGDKQLPIITNETYQVPHCRNHFVQDLPESNANYDYVRDLDLGWGNRHVLSYVFEDFEFVFQRNSLFLDFWKALGSNLGRKVGANPQDRYVLMDWRDVPAHQRNALIRLRVELPEVEMSSDSTSSQLEPALSSGLSSGGSCQFHAASASVLTWLFAVLLLLALNGRALLRSRRIRSAICSLFLVFGFTHSSFAKDLGQMNKDIPTLNEPMAPQAAPPPSIGMGGESFQYSSDDFPQVPEYSSKILNCSELLPNYVDTQIDFIKYFDLGPMGSYWQEEDPSLSLKWEALASQFSDERNPYARYLVFFNSVAELEELSFKVDLHTNFTQQNIGIWETTPVGNYWEDTSFLWKDLFAVSHQHYDILESRGYFSGNSFPFFADSTTELAKGVRVALQTGELNILPLDQFAPHIQIQSLLSDEPVSQHFCFGVITAETKLEIEEAQGHPLSPAQLIATSETTSSSFDDPTSGGPLSQEDIMISESGANSFSGATAGRCQMASTQTSLSFQLMIWTLLLSLLLFRRSSFGQ